MVLHANHFARVREKSWLGGGVYLFKMEHQKLTWQEKIKQRTRVRDGVGGEGVCEVSALVLQ